MSWCRNPRRLILVAGSFIWLGLWLPGGFQIAADAQSHQQPSAAKTAERQASGSIAGTLVDQTGALATGARVLLTRPDQSLKQEVLSGDGGRFAFTNVPPGPFQLTITSGGFEPKVFPGILRPGEAFVTPDIVLEVAAVTIDVRVGLPTEEVAEAQIKEQEKQRVLGIIPNFYVSYVPDAAPLTPRQKFQLAWKVTIDPVTFAGAGALAGLEQAADDYSGYGQGAQGYAKRFGANYADIFIGTFVDSAILPSLLKQDPRYFYKGTGSTRSRMLYALRNSVVCKGDNKRWQPNYSAIVGSFATGGISYLYYPASDRGVGLLMQTSLIRIAEGSLAGVIQEFLLRKFTTRAKNPAQAQPSDRYPAEQAAKQ